MRVRVPPSAPCTRPHGFSACKRAPRGIGVRRPRCDAPSAGLARPCAGITTGLGPGARTIRASRTGNDRQRRGPVSQLGHSSSPLTRWQAAPRGAVRFAIGGSGVFHGRRTYRLLRVSITICVAADRRGVASRIGNAQPSAIRQNAHTDTIRLCSQCLRPSADQISTPSIERYAAIHRHDLAGHVGGGDHCQHC